MKRCWIRYHGCLVMIASMAFLTGCGQGGGRGQIAVTGTVTLDGAALAGAAVMFGGAEGADPVTAVTDASGTFSLQAVAGRNLVAVSKTEPGSGGPPAEDDGLMPSGDAPPAPTKPLVPGKYANFRTSGLEVNVSVGMEPVNIELTW